MFRDASDIEKGSQNEIKKLPNEIVFKDGADDLPKEISLIDNGGESVKAELPLEKDNLVNALNKDVSRTPYSNGTWSGERGKSTWYPDRDYTPPEKSPEGYKPYSNPENKTWGEILDKYGIKGIVFIDGYPDFSEISRGTVEIKGFEAGGNEAKNRNFVKADIALAEKRGCTPEEVAKWRKENNYTWHECEDKKTMQKVPNEVHANIPHDGGRSQE